MNTVTARINVYSHVWHHSLILAPLNLRTIWRYINQFFTFNILTYVSKIQIRKVTLISMVRKCTSDDSSLILHTGSICICILVTIKPRFKINATKQQHKNLSHTCPSFLQWMELG